MAQDKFLYDKVSMNKNRNTIVIGDFNYSDINWKRNTAGSTGKGFLKLCNDLSLLQCVKNKTRGKNILDLVMVYDKNLIYNIRQEAPMAKSDHNVVNVTLNVTLNVMVKMKNKQV